MSEYVGFPDAEVLARFIIIEANASSRVYSSLPAKNPVFPLITLHRNGGVPTDRHFLDRARILVNSWGATKGEARALADAARLAIHEAEGNLYLIEGGDPVDAVLNGVEDIVGINWQPDPVTQRDRYIFEVALTLHLP